MMPSKRRRRVHVTAHGRVVTVKRRGDKVIVAPLLRQRLRDRRLRAVRFKASDVRRLLFREPRLFQPDGWLVFDFGPGESLYRVEYAWSWRVGFRQLRSSGWRKVVRS